MLPVKTIRYYFATPLWTVRIAVIAGSIIGILVTLSLLIPAAAVLSLVSAASAVILPQVALLFLSLSRRPFNIWLCRFSLIVLLLAVAGRGLAEAELLSGIFFLTGVVGGILFNLMTATWFFRQAVMSRA